VSALREALLEVETLLAYDIDFPEEDDGPVPRERISAAVAAARERLDALLRTATAGELVRDGAVAVIAGPPNVGKSSLFNALVGRARALVTEIPGTTRDALEAVIDAGDWPVRLIDTAGLRASDDVVERLGIEVAERHIASAQLVLACGDGRQALADAVRRARALTDRPIIAVRTKADLANGGGESRSVADVPDGAVEEVDVSAQTRAGLPALLNAISRRLTGDFGALSPDAPVVTRARHRLALGRARAELVAFEEAWREGVLPATVAAVPLRSAVAALEELIGAVGPEDVLDRLFRTFCVGK
jgi:tRNA modification GTPase